MRHFMTCVAVRAALLWGLGALGPLSTLANAALDDVTASKVDDLVRSELQRTGVASTSIALVVDGRMAYAKAFGLARLEPVLAADPKQRYRIGSITKQFVAAAMVRLQTQGFLNLDDPLARYLPDAGTAGKASLRQLLSHTAGVREYLPQDYVFAELLLPTTVLERVEQIAKQPLDFVPGQSWRYSNSGYVLAGAVVEKVTGKSLFHYLREQFFDPLAMVSVVDADDRGLAVHDPIGYSVTGLGRPKPTQNMAAGWLCAAGGLGMSAEDLAKWDVALMGGRLLSPQEHKTLGTEMLLNNGVGSRYALGLNVRMFGGRRMWMHNGGVPGFLANNIVFPDDGLAIVVLTNGDFMDAAGAIAGRLQRMLLTRLQPQDNSRTPKDEHILQDLQHGSLDRSQLTAHASAYFEEPVLRETSHVLTKAGAVKSFELKSQATLGGMQERHYVAVLEHQRYSIVVRIDANGLVEQYTLSPE